MNFDWSMLFTSWGGSALVGLAAAGTIVELFFKKKIEAEVQNKYDAVLEILKKENQKELEGFKAGYQKVLDENKIRFSKWHDAQADAIKTMYARLTELKNALQCMVNPYKLLPEGMNLQEETKKEEKRFIDAYIDSHSFFESNKILFYENHISKLNDLYEKVISAIKNHGMSKNRNSDSTTSFQLADKANNFAKSLDNILDDLRKDFRSILEGKKEEQRL